MTYPADLQRISAWRTTLGACLLNALGWPLELIIEWRIPHMPRWAALASSAVGLALASAMVIARRRISVTGSSVLFLVNSIVIAAALWITDTAYAAYVPGWVPYQASKLGVLVVALLSPELWVGIVSFVLYAGSAVLHDALFAATRGRTFGEPWSMVIYGVFALALLWLTHRRRAAEWRAIGAEANAEGMRRLAKSTMAISDLCNTPLQTIELAAALLRRAHPGLDTELGRVDRALARLRELNAILLEYRSEAEDAWSRDDEAFDARERLRQPQSQDASRHQVVHARSELAGGHGARDPSRA
jgi:hypothetical protein